MGPAGFEPATQRMQAQLQYGLYFTLFYGAAVNLAVWSFIPTGVHLSLILNMGTLYYLSPVPS